jgi:hypothetical protein
VIKAALRAQFKAAQKVLESAVAVSTVLAKELEMSISKS